MKFEILKSYALAAKLYKGEPIETNDLVLKVRNSSPKGWVKVRNNNNTQWPGEKLENRINEEGKNELWSYRCLDKFDFILYSLLINRFEASIIGTYMKKQLYRYGTDDEWCEFVEPWFNQTIRHYDPYLEAIKINNKTKTTNSNKTAASFKSLWIIMLNNCARNFVNQFNIQHCKIDKKTGTRVKDENGTVIKTIEYKPRTISLDQINDENIVSYTSQLPCNQINECDIIKELKLKYQTESDLLTWLLLDIEAEDSKILSDKRLYNTLMNFNNTRSRKEAIHNLYDEIITLGLFRDYGFDAIDNHNKFNRLWDKSISSLKSDAKAYDISI